MGPLEGDKVMRTGPSLWDECPKETPENPLAPLPGDVIVRKQLSTNQEEVPHQIHKLPAP